MRSVFFYVNATEAELTQHLEGCYRLGTHGWINKADTVLIDFWKDFDKEIEYGTWQLLNDQLGENKFICIMVDISGRVPGDLEVMECANYILGKFNGLAQDDYSDELWTFDEIKDRVIKSGHCFFDYSKR